MKKIIILLITLALIVGLTACGQKSPTPDTNGGKVDETSQGDNNETITLRYAEAQPDNSVLTVSALKFAELVEEKSDGRIKIEVYSGGQLGEEIDTLSSLQMGTLDISRTASNALIEFGTQKMNAFAMPYVFRDHTHLWNVLESDMAQELLKEPLEVGAKMVGIMYLDEGARHYFTNKPVNSIEDMKGLKIRTPGSQIVIDTTAALGASPTPLSYSELYAALQTKTVDGAENALTGYLSNKFYEVAPYCIKDGHIWNPSITLMSQSTWEKLSVEDQQIIMEAARETSALNKEDSKSREMADQAELEKAGVKFTEVPDKTPWQNATEIVIDKYGSDIIDVLDTISGM